MSKKDKPAEVKPAAAVAEAGPLSNKTYAAELKKLHVELVKLQLWVQHAGLKVVIIFEAATRPARAARSRP